MRSTLAASFVVIGLLAGCSSTPMTQDSGAAVEDRSASDTIPTVTPDRMSGGLLPELTDPSSPLSKRSVFFDYDSFVIRGEYMTLVENHARFLVAHPEYKMLIQGNADERGSREYNLALGQKRADAMKKALLLLGATENQVEAVSLGEEKPRCTDASESCFAENRRGDMLYSGEF